MAMHALAYSVTKHTIPGWVPFHEKEQRGIAYEGDTHFVHFFGRDHGLWIISTGLTVTQRKSGSLTDWIRDTFGAVDVEPTQLEPGHTVAGVWRPGLYFSDETLEGLSGFDFEFRLSQQALLLLIQRLDELLHFVEPSPETLKTHGHKARELLILSCTEVENSWKAYMRMAGVSSSAADFTTKDYVRLLNPLHLSDYEISLPRYKDVPPIRPFHGWSHAQPTRSLSWYDAYNKTKHDRTACFEHANLWNCLQAVAANLTLFSVKYGPFHLFQGGGTLSACFNQLFDLQLRDPSPSTFYAPKLSLPLSQRVDLICFGSQELVVPRTVNPLVL